MAVGAGGLLDESLGLAAEETAGRRDLHLRRDEGARAPNWRAGCANVVSYPGAPYGHYGGERLIALGGERPSDAKG